MDGQAGPGYEYGRLEIFLRGIWRTICDSPGSFTPDSAALACESLGFGGGVALEFRQTYIASSRFSSARGFENQVMTTQEAVLAEGAEGELPSSS